jgi:fatty-acyl-CoA synthase
MARRETKRGWIGWLAWAALLAGLAGPLLILTGAVGTRAGLWDWTVGFGRLTVGWASQAALVGAVLGVLASGAALANRRFLVPALAGLMLAGATLGGFWQLRQIARANPIHDVSTDWTDPPTFSAETLADRRATGARNPVERDPVHKVDGREVRVAETSARLCPAATPVFRTVTRSEAEAALRRVGATVTRSGPDRVEGVHTSLMFGFKDDIVVRLGEGRADVRSVSRVGGSDLGANCRRVTRIVEALSARQRS